MERYKLYLRHILPLLLILISIIILFIITINRNDFNYIYNSYYDGYLIESYKGNDKKIEIDEYYNDKKIVGIAEYAFYENDKIEEIILNPNIKIIDRMAFSNCINLSKINLDNVEYIGRNAFSYCYSLDNLNINSINILGSTFYKCNNLKNINLLNDVKSIGIYAFSYTKIEELYLPINFSTIYDDAFIYSNIKRIYTYNDIYYEGIEIIKM